MFTAKRGGECCRPIIMRISKGKVGQESCADGCFDQGRKRRAVIECASSKPIKQNSRVRHFFRKNSPPIRLYGLGSGLTAGAAGHQVIRSTSSQLKEIFLSMDGGGLK